MSRASSGAVTALVPCRTRPFIRVVLLVCCVLLAPSAFATPQFARETELPCRSCHEHVPLLNSFGQFFYSNGFKLGKRDVKKSTIPAWASVAAQATFNRGLGDSVPISYAGTQIGSYGYVDKVDLLYHLMIQPVASTSQISVTHPFSDRTAIQIGQITPISQFDPRLDIPLSQPAYLLPGGNGPLGNGRFGPFAESGIAYGARITESLTGHGALPYSDGWKVAATGLASGEVACTLQPTLDDSHDGLNLETYYRKGMNSIGASTFTSKDGRRAYGMAGQYFFKKGVYIEGGAVDDFFLGAQSHVYSLGISWIPVSDKALSLRIDDQDGVANLVPTLSWLIGGRRGVVRVVLESTINRNVAPSTVASVQVKF